MNKEEKKKHKREHLDLMKELLYITKFVGIEYCKCTEREDAEDCGSLDRDDDGYFLMTPSYSSHLKMLRVEFCPWCSKRLFTFGEVAL